jgi:hypothetical protein
MTSPPGSARVPSSTVHLTDKKVPEKVNRALLSRATVALAEVSGMQTKSARRLVVAYASGALPVAADGWASWLRNWHQIADPTGETAVHNVMKLGGLDGAA